MHRSPPPQTPPQTPPSPVNPLPAAVLVLVIPMIAVEALFALGARGLIGGPDALGWRLAAIERFGVFTAVLEWMRAGGGADPAQLVRALAYPFVHLSFTHALFVIVFILAIGKMVGEIFRPWATLAVFFGAALAGAAVHTMVLGEPGPLVGGYPAVYGLIGAFSFVQWVYLGAIGAERHRAFTLIAMLLGIQLIFGVLFGGTRGWVVDLAGFATGFGLSFVVSPGGWRRVVARLRQR